MVILCHKLRFSNNNISVQPNVVELRLKQKFCENNYSNFTPSGCKYMLSSIILLQIFLVNHNFFSFSLKSHLNALIGYILIIFFFNIL